MKSKKFYALMLAVITLVCASSAFAQTDRGSINGTVKDPSGAVVPNAKVTVTNLDSGEVRETTTSDDGTFNLPELKADPYRLSVESAGFKTATIDTIQVAVQVARRADVTLEIGEVGETVTVSSDATVLQTESPVQQLNVTERQVKELPLLVSAESGGRSPLSFIFLDSTVTPTGSGSSGTNASNFRVNGGQGLGTDILIDGAATRRAENGTFFSEVAPGPNAFQEFTLSTSNYSAEFGNSTGGIVNFTIKSGGNEFHGEGWYYLRNEALNANIDLNRLNGFDRPLDRQKDFGFNVSGPVYLPRFGEGGPTYLSG
ncbi:MAG TPA: carboxypeptidase regulatory-like domain-containing protein, partial [Pyrinomonadaceae bacterium]